MPQGGAESGALSAGIGSDPRLARVIEAWPALPDHIKAAVLALVQAGR